jgi:hypothetical protein
MAKASLSAKSPAAAVPDPDRAPAPALAREIDRLSVIARDLESAAAANEPLAAVPDLSGPMLKTDNALQRYASELRAGFLRAMALKYADHWLTPPTGRKFVFPGSAIAYDYAYDRQHIPEVIERRLRDAGHRRGRKGALICGSGMAAITIAAQSLAALLPELSISALASYFETFTLLSLSGLRDRCRRVTEQEQLHRAFRTGGANVIYIEPVQYNWRLNSIDWDRLLAEIDGAADPPVVILDTTLSGSSPVLEDLIDRFLASRCPLLLCLRSGLKLDQEGLELANLGVLEWWIRDDNDPALARLQAVAEAYRTVAGVGIGWHAACALSPGFVLDHRRAQAFSASIFASNRALFAATELSGDIFVRKTYAPPPWDAPFVLFHLRQGNARQYQLLAALIAREAERRRLDWTMSGSFGFRTERFETILPGEQKRAGERPEGVLKIACGCYRGARFWAIVDLINELARFNSIEHAAQRWGQAQ